MPLYFFNYSLFSMCQQRTYKRIFANALSIVNQEVFLQNQAYLVALSERMWNLALQSPKTYFHCHYVYDYQTR